MLGGFGWQRDDMKLVQQMAATGAEPIGSLGYDGPLAALSPERQNLADYFKESVAVVTNPAIDREREVEHFSCRAVFGARPGIDAVPEARTTDRDRVPDHPRRPRRARAALRLRLPPRRARAQDLPARGPLGGVPRPRARARPLVPRVGGHARRVERLKHEATARRERRRRAARAVGPDRLRGRPPLPRSAPGARGRGPGAARALHPPRARRTCAAAAGWCCARPPCATCTT